MTQKVLGRNYGDIVVAFHSINKDGFAKISVTAGGGKSRCNLILEEGGFEVLTFIEKDYVPVDSIKGDTIKRSMKVKEALVEVRQMIEKVYGVKIRTVEFIDIWEDDPTVFITEAHDKAK